MTDPASTARLHREDAFPDPRHDHHPCVAEALARARAAFEAKGLRLTGLRQTVLEEIAGSHHAVGAYELLERLATKGRRLAPISVYRAIDALREAGVVHRLESRNAFFACHGAHAAGGTLVVLACEGCGTVAEVDGGAVAEAIADAARPTGFHPRAAVVEVLGLCGHCPATG